MIHDLNFFQYILYLYYSKIKKLSDCEILDHKWKYNFPSLPSKRICIRCKKKETFDLRNLVWTDVPFQDTRSDEELIKVWFNEPKIY